MISYLSGTPIILHDRVILLVNGVGYGVYVGAKTLRRFADLPNAELYIHTHVREDAITLFGFEDHSSLSLFEQLLDVSGVGPKTAVVIADAGANAVVTAVQTADVAFFSAMPRIGKKLAQKIIIELKSKLGSLKDLDLQPESQQQTQVTQALTSLGFAEHDIAQALQSIQIESLTLEQAIKTTIQAISTRR